MNVKSNKKSQTNKQRVILPGDLLLWKTPGRLFEMVISACEEKSSFDGLYRTKITVLNSGKIDTFLLIDCVISRPDHLTIISRLKGLIELL